MKNLLKLSFTAIFAAIMFIGCSTEDNPLAQPIREPAAETLIP
jgi:hypothetical protein